MGVAVWMTWAEVLLLATTVGFGLATRNGPEKYTDRFRTVHLSFALLSLIGMIVLAITITAVVR